MQTTLERLVTEAAKVDLKINIYKQIQGDTYRHEEQQ
jgi:hypothetical protein